MTADVDPLTAFGITHDDDTNSSVTKITGPHAK